VARLYVRMGDEIRNGTLSAPTFDNVVRSIA